VDMMNTTGDRMRKKSALFILGCYLWNKIRRLSFSKDSLESNNSFLSNDKLFNDHNFFEDVQLLFESGALFNSSSYSLMLSLN